jgi:putative chitinase
MKQLVFRICGGNCNQLFQYSLAKQYERNPQKIASKVYGGRMGNGVEATGEGYKFRGRGYIQLTGKDN